MKTEETRRIESLLLRKYFEPGSHIAFEVNLKTAWERSECAAAIGDPHERPLNPGIADAVQVDSSGTITCFEIKVTKSDFHSNAALAFVGDKNYYAMPYRLYEQVKDEIPKGIGVFVIDAPPPNNWFHAIRPCRKRPMTLDREQVLLAVIRASHNNTTLRRIKEMDDSLCVHRIFVDETEETNEHQDEI